MLKVSSTNVTQGIVGCLTTARHLPKARSVIFTVFGSISIKRCVPRFSFACHQVGIVHNEVLEHNLLYILCLGLDDSDDLDKVIELTEEFGE